MEINEIIDTINELSAGEYERGFVSFRSDKGIIINPEKEFFKISPADIEIVGKERNVNKEKAAHLTAYERNSEINVIIHVQPEFASKIAEKNLSIRPYSAAEATVIGARLSCCLDNVYQLADGILTKRAALTRGGLYTAGATSDEALNRVRMIERAARIEYLINMPSSDVKNGEASETHDEIKSGVKSKKRNKLKGAARLGCLKARKIFRDYLSGAAPALPFSDRFCAGFGYYSRLDNGVLCAADVNAGEEIILNKKTSGGKIFKIFAALYEGDYHGSAVIYNGANTVIAAGRQDIGLISSGGVKSDAAGIAKAALENGCVLLPNYGALVLGDSVDDAMNNAEQLDIRCGELIAELMLNAYRGEE